MRLVHHKYYDDYNTPNTRRVDETTFTMPDTMEQHQIYEIE